MRLIFTLLPSLLLLSPICRGEEPAVMRLLQIEALGPNGATVLKQNGVNFAAKPQMSLLAGDGLLSAKESISRLSLGDGSLILLSPNAKFFFQSASKSGSGKFHLTFALTAGAMRLVRTKNADVIIRINGRTALIYPQSGADLTFFYGESPPRDHLWVLAGKVNFFSAKNRSGLRSLQAGQTSFLDAGQSRPTVPAVFSIGDIEGAPPAITPLLTADVLVQAPGKATLPLAAKNTEDTDSPSEVTSANLQSTGTGGSASLADFTDIDSAVIGENPFATDNTPTTTTNTQFSDEAAKAATISQCQDGEGFAGENQEFCGAVKNHLAAQPPQAGCLDVASATLNASTCLADFSTPTTPQKSPLEAQCENDAEFRGRNLPACRSLQNQTGQVDITPTGAKPQLQDQKPRQGL